MPRALPPAGAAAAPQPRRAQALRAALARALAPLGHALGGIFLIPNPWVGLLLGLALISHPVYLLLALEGFLVGAVVNRLLGLRDDPGAGDGVETNALLAAVVMGWLTGAGGLPLHVQMLLAAAAAVPAALLAAALIHFLSRSPMPAVLLAYCAVAAMLFAICPQCTVAASNDMPPWPQLAGAGGWGESLLRSLSALMYGHDALSGAFVAGAVLLWSRAMFACGIAGWIAGALAALAFQRAGLSYFWLPLSYNFFLAGSALGAVLFLPGRGSLAVAAAAGALSAFFGLALQYVLHGSSTSYLPLSAALAIWVGIGALSAVAQRPVRTAAADAPVPPELSWWRWAYWRARFGVPVPLFAVPVAGELRVAQGFGGSPSHAGAFRHALDFERPRVAGEPLGAIFGAEVVSPVAGTVERVRSHVADNPPGVCNYAERWGNYVVIRLDAGEHWALLAHLQQGSVAVLPGMRVEVGTYLGRVGNSGRSVFAHLHMQLQSAAEPGSATCAFRLANYLRSLPAPSATRPWAASAVPPEGEVVMAAARNQAVYLSLIGIAPGTAVWTLESSGRVPRGFRERVEARAQRVDVSVDSLGRHVFSAAHGGSLVACLDPDAWRVVDVTGRAAPLLKLIALAVPTIPYAARAGTAWTDLPPLMPAPGRRGALALALAPYLRHAFVRVSSACVADPAADTLSFEVLSHVDTPAADLPLTLSCTCCALRGPVRVHAEFEGGSLTYSLLSYQAGSAPAAVPR